MASSAPQKPRKPRTTNPGVRVQGGRIYDSESGTTCHQCRQKTVELKANCTTCPLHWCPRCLLNRYGEEVAQVCKLQEWQCPRCRKLCNCSNCRKKGGLEATGILSHMCKAAGLGSVSDLLAKNPAAKRPASATADSPAAPAKAPKKQKQKLACVDSQGSHSLAGDCTAAWTATLPALQPLSMPCTVSRGRREVALGRSPLPDGCPIGDVLEVLEFLQTFGGLLGLRLPGGSLERLLQELLQPQEVTAARRELRGESSSCTAALHACLLQHVRWAAGIRLPVGFWQEGMRTYMAENLREAVTLTTTPQTQALAAAPEDSAGPAEAPAAAAAADDSGVEVLLEAYEQQGYWGVPSHIRLALLRSLCNSLLDTPLFRSHIDAEVEREEQAAKESRMQQAAARKASKEAAQHARDREIAALLAGAGGQAMTLEQQRALMTLSSAKLAAASHQQPASGLQSSAHVRAVQLGSDREGRAHLRLSCASLVTGSDDAVLVCQQDDQFQCDTWQCCTAPQDLAAALHPHAEPEASLKASLIADCSLTMGSAIDQGYPSETL